MPQFLKKTTTTTTTVTKADGSKTTTTTRRTIYEQIAEILKELSTKPRIQDDFYQHANHEWLSDPSAVIPDEYPEWGSFLMLRDQSLKDQISLLHELMAADPATLTAEQVKIRSVWTASMKRFEQWSESPTTGSYAPIHELLTLIDSKLADGTDESLAKLFAQFKQLGLSFPLYLGTISNLEDAGNEVFILFADGLSLPSREYYFDDNFQAKREMFVEHLNKVVGLVGEENLVPDFAQKVLSFETKIAKITLTTAHSQKLTKFYTITTLEDLVPGINELRTHEEKLKSNYETEDPLVVSNEAKARIATFMDALVEELNLRSVMRANYAKNYSDKPIEGHSKMIAFDGDYLRRVFPILFENRDELRAYLQYKAIHRASQYCTKALDEEFFDIYTRKFRGQKEQKSDEKRSIALVDDWVGFLLGQMYVDRYFGNEDKARLQGMIDEVVQAMEASIKRNDWLTDATKVEAEKKLSQFTTKIGFPDVWVDYSRLEITGDEDFWTLSKKVEAFKVQKNFYDKINRPVDKNEWFMTPQTVNAYYNPTENEICFPAAIIQPPFYAGKLEQVGFQITPEDREAVGDEALVLDAVNFGGIAAVIAHEITHGFDDEGRNFDGAGNVRDWWSEADGKLFKAKCDIMEKQKYSFTESETGKVHEMNAVLTMGENLADLGGISLSCQALLKRAEVKGKVDARLPLLRILFQSWANIWKSKATEAHIINRMATDPHAPACVRGNLVKNIDYFYEAYDVKEGDGMYVPPEDRVAMW